MNSSFGKVALALIAVGLPLISVDACTAILVGKKASATGSVLVGHNLDTSGAIIRYAMFTKRDGKPAMFWDEGKKVAGNDKVSHLFCNEYGVMVTSNNGGVQKEWDGVKYSLPKEGKYSSLKDGGLGYMLRVRMIEKAKSAREAVRIMAELLEEYGYNQLSRNFLIADAEEAWVFSALYGRRFAARRVPDDAVCVFPNCLVVNKLQEGDVVSESFKGKGPDFDMIAAYQGPRTWKSPYNYYRMKEMYRIVAGVNVEDGLAEYPFSMRPAHKISVEDIKRGLCSHYEGQSFEVKKRHPVKNPKIIAPICRNTTIEALVCEMMPKLADIKFHMTVGRPCEVPYSTYQPFAGILPPGTVFNEAAEERLKKYILPLSKQ